MFLSLSLSLSLFLFSPPSASPFLHTGAFSTYQSGANPSYSDLKISCNCSAALSAVIWSIRLGMSCASSVDIGQFTSLTCPQVDYPRVCLLARCPATLCLKWNDPLCALQICCIRLKVMYWNLALDILIPLAADRTHNFPPTQFPSLSKLP